MNYRKIKFGDACELVRGISYKSSDYSVAEDPDAEVFINLKCVTKDGFRNDGIKYYKGDHKNTQSLTTGDLLIANTDLTRNRAVIGNSILVPALDRSRACFSMDLCKINITDSSKLDKLYLYYYLKSPKARWYMINHSDGSTVVHLSTSSVSEMEMEVPSIEEQKKIVSILSSIDRKIACNNRTNDNLREIIKARYNYLIKSTDWPKIELGTVATISSGKRPAAKIASGRVPVVGANGVMAYTNDYNFNEDVIITGRVGTLGAIKRYNDKIWASDNTLVIQTKYLNYVENYLKNLDIQSLNRGSTQPLLTNSDLKKQIIMFNESGVLKFERENQIIIDTIRGNNLENERLTKLRDTLLPELLNGKIDISNIDI